METTFTSLQPVFQREVNLLQISIQYLDKIPEQVKDQAFSRSLDPPEL
jgi:hypothetical protein